jgi:hypothetical protein
MAILEELVEESRDEPSLDKTLADRRVLRDQS